MCVLFLGMHCDWLTQFDVSHQCVAAKMFAYNGPPLFLQKLLFSPGDLHPIYYSTWFLGPTQVTVSDGISFGSAILQGS